MSLAVFRWDAPGPYEVVFSTRLGGVSEGPFESLNLGRRTGDDVERVDENRRRLCSTIGADEEQLALGYQTHSTIVNRAQAGSRGIPGDALWTDEPGVPIVTLGADCVLIALARTNGDAPALAVLHAGWRGLADGIVEAAAQALGGAPGGDRRPGDRALLLRGRRGRGRAFSRQVRARHRQRRQARPVDGGRAGRA